MRLLALHTKIYVHLYLIFVFKSPAAAVGRFVFTLALDDLHQLGSGKINHFQYNQ